MSDETQLIIAAPPSAVREATAYALPVAHMAYRIGQNLQLLRANIPINLRAGLMMICCSGFDGHGDVINFCRQVIRECSIRNFDGIVLDFEGSAHPLLGQVVSKLGAITAQRNWPLFVPEEYAAFSDHTKIMISSALSGGSLQQRISDAVTQFNPRRIALCVQQVAEDFTLPAPSGCGTPLTQEELKRLIQTRGASVYFSTELCAHYFTYVSRQNGAHFVLFDNAGSLRKKIQTAKQFNLHSCILAWPEVKDIMDTILP